MKSNDIIYTIVLLSKVKEPWSKIKEEWEIAQYIEKGDYICGICQKKLKNQIMKLYNKQNKAIVYCHFSEAGYIFKEEIKDILIMQDNYRKKLKIKQYRNRKETINEKIKYISLMPPTKAYHLSIKYTKNGFLSENEQQQLNKILKQQRQFLYEHEEFISELKLISRGFLQLKSKIQSEYYNTGKVPEELMNQLYKTTERIKTIKTIQMIIKNKKITKWEKLFLAQIMEQAAMESPFFGNQKIIYNTICQKIKRNINNKKP